MALGRVLRAPELVHAVLAPWGRGAVFLIRTVFHVFRRVGIRRGPILILSYTGDLWAAGG